MRFSLLAIMALTLSSSAAAQTPESTWKVIRPDGVARASALVDSVYIDHHLKEAVVDGGDFAAYLMARLGAANLPPDFNYRVAIDPTEIRLSGRLSELPPEAQRSLSQLLMVFPADSKLEAQITLHRAGPQAVRFHLAGVRVRGIPVPETILTPVMNNIGNQYPVLTSTGRDLLVQVPERAAMTLVPGGVRLTAAPAP